MRAGRGRLRCPDATFAGTGSVRPRAQQRSPHLGIIGPPGPARRQAVLAQEKCHDVDVVLFRKTGNVALRHAQADFPEKVGDAVPLAQELIARETGPETPFEFRSVARGALLPVPILTALGL